MSGLAVQLRILGPVEIRRAGVLAVPRRRLARVVLGMLALRVPEPVSMDWIIDGLWPRTPPRSAAANVRTYIAALRNLLDPVISDGPHIDSVRGNYRLVAGPTGLDSLLFERYAAEGRRFLAAGRHADAAEILARACGLWRGPVLDATPIPEPVVAAATMLEDRRLDTIEEWIEARLAIGQHADVAVELRGLIQAHGLRERLWGQRMLALYRCGRRAEAIAAYQDLARLLESELDVQPGPAVQRLHQRILRSDPALQNRESTMTYCDVV